MQDDYYDTEAYDVAESVREKHRSAADSVLTKDEYGHLIGGEWVDTEDGKTGPAIDPTTGEELATVQVGTEADVDKAVAAANDALEGTWGQLGPRQRAEKLEEIVDRLEDVQTDIAKIDSLEAGKPNMHSRFVDSEVLLEQFRHWAAIARTEDDGRVVPSGDDKRIITRREPMGVVGAISAWNFPAMFVAWKLGPALAGGNTVVFKPASKAVLSSLEVIRVVDNVLPPGTVNIVTGPGSEVGASISSHQDVDKVTLTGSRWAGVQTIKNAAETVTPASVELGGKSPNIIFPDADLEKAIEGTLVSIFFNSGQQCTAGSRLFLHEDIKDEFLDMFLERTADLEVGDPLGPTTDIGPMIDQDHMRDVTEYVEGAVEDGATVLAGDDADETFAGRSESDTAGAPFVQPTILTDLDDDAQISCEEVFGPVLAVFEWSEKDEVIRRANDTDFGLASAVWTEDLEDAHDVAAQLEAGTVWVNTYNDLLEPVPHGGYKESGIGRELGDEALDDYTQVKTVNINIGDIPKF
jgi:aldehyde dehydrogenase (NAD+)